MSAIERYRNAIEHALDVLDDQWPQPGTGLQRVVDMLHESLVGSAVDLGLPEGRCPICYANRNPNYGEVENHRDPAAFQRAKDRAARFAATGEIVIPRGSGDTDI